MDDAENEARELLRAYRDATEPDPARTAAAWSALAAATGAGAAAQTPTAPSRMARWKLGLAVLAIGTLGGVIASGRVPSARTEVADEHPSVVEVAAADLAEPIALHEDEPAVAPADAVTDAVEPLVVAEPPPTSAPRTRAPRRASEPVVTAQPAELAPPALEVAAETAPPPAAGPATQVTASNLAEELALLREAERALAARDPSTALAALERHRTRFPAGSLANERELVRIRALCDAGRASEAHELASEAGSAAARRVLSRCTPVTR